MSYISLLCSITCLSFAWHALAADGHINYPPIIHIGEFNHPSYSSPSLGNTTEDRSLTPYHELSSATADNNSAFQDIEKRIHNNIAINDIKKITEKLGLLITPLTKVTCNRITFYPLHGRPEELNVNNKIWIMVSENRKATLGNTLAPLDRINEPRKEVTFISFSDGKSRILFELNDKLQPGNRPSIRNITINY